MLLSSLGVVFGVAFFITGQAQTQGFQDFFIQTVLGTKGAIVVDDRFQETYSPVKSSEGKTDMVMVNNPQARKYTPGIDESQKMINVMLSNFPNVVAASPIVTGGANLRSGFRSSSADIYGIDLDPHLHTTDFAGQVIGGSIEEFRANGDSIAIGKGMADKLELNLGQNVYIFGEAGDTRHFKFNLMYETGIGVIDERRIYIHRGAAQQLLHLPYTTSQILVRLRDPMRAPQDATRFEQVFAHRSRPWQEYEKGNLQIFTTVRISATLGISCIILLAGFGIFNVLTMAVMERTKEISILRSMGYTRNDISMIFIFQGLCIAVIGIIIGSGFGAFFTLLVERIPIKIRGIFKADHFMVQWSVEHYIWAAILALLSVLVAAYIPARRAASIEPVRVLRGVSG